MIIENILAAFVELGTIKTFILMMVGVAGGLIAGAIPGFTIAMAVVLTLPFTFGMPAPQGLATMVSVLVGGLSGGLMAINDWIDQTLAAKSYIQAQEDREDFIVATGAGATKFNKWMKKAGLHFNKQSGRWTRWSDR